MDFHIHIMHVTYRPYNQIAFDIAEESMQYGV